MDDALSGRMNALGDHILHAREWKALEIVKEEIINLHGLVESLRHNCNVLFEETRDCIKADKDARAEKRLAPTEGITRGD